MVSDATLRKTGWAAAGILATVAVAGAGAGKGWWLGYRQGLDTARIETAATLRDEVEVASALRVGNSRLATFLLEIRIDEHTLRLLEQRPAVFGVLTRIQEGSPERALPRRTYRASFTYKFNESGRWRAVAPYSIDIAP
jgi:hypothetical protein